jgi:hypothetical protein
MPAVAAQYRAAALTEQDQRAFQLYVPVEQRGRGDIVVKVEGEDDREKTSG